ncbi:MAG: hypothetical protein EOM74_01945 [Methanomicrobia archaeon]|nr:hypothetical protein [Methanomicrobia archaeon]
MIAWFDLETTGLDIENDRIIQMSLIITDDDGKNTIKKYEWHFNPEGSPISKGAFEKHGIAAESLEHEKRFSHYARTIRNLMVGPNDDNIIGGHNIKCFDLPFINNSFKRAGLDPIGIDYVQSPAEGQKTHECIDTFEIYNKYQHHHLVDIFSELLWQEAPECAHDASCDTKMAIAVYNVMSVKFADELAKSKHERRIDSDGRFICNTETNSVIITFGKYAGEDIRDIPESYLQWITEAKFEDSTKVAAKKLIDLIHSEKWQKS